MTIQIEELGQQRASLTGGRGQFGSTLGIIYTLFNLFHGEELLSSRIEGGPESLELAIGFAKEGFLGSRGSLALSVFNALLRPRLSGSAKGPFFKQESAGIDGTWNYALTNVDSLSVSYDLSRTRTRYSPVLPPGLTGLDVNDMQTASSRHALGLGWTRDNGAERISSANSVSGGWLGGNENVVRSKAELERAWRDPWLDSPKRLGIPDKFQRSGQLFRRFAAVCEIVSRRRFRERPTRWKSLAAGRDFLGFVQRRDEILRFAGRRRSGGRRERGISRAAEHRHGSFRLF